MPPSCLITEWVQLPSYQGLFVSLHLSVLDILFQYFPSTKQNKMLSLPFSFSLPLFPATRNKHSLTLKPRQGGGDWERGKLGSRLEKLSTKEGEKREGEKEKQKRAERLQEHKDQGIKEEAQKEVETRMAQASRCNARWTQGVNVSCRGV